jgi:hypothetical protein
MEGMMGEGIFDRQYVACRVREACDTLRRLPAGQIQGYRSAWPEMMAECIDAAGGDSVVRLAAASPRAIDRMLEVFGWFFHLRDRPHLAAALWMTCGRGMGPSRAGALLGIHRDTVRNRRDEALDLMAEGERRRRRAA